MQHAYDVAVRWSDEDRLGHINNTRYLTFAEDARLVWFGASPMGSGGVILARTEIDFRSQVHFSSGGHLLVRTDVLSIGSSSLTLRQNIVDDHDQTVAGTRHVLVCFDYTEQRSRPWTEQERTWLSDYVVKDASRG